MNEISFAISVISLIVTISTLAIVQKNFQLPFRLYQFLLFISRKEFEVDIACGMTMRPQDGQPGLKKRQAKLRRVLYHINGLNKRLGITSGKPSSIGHLAQFRTGEFVVGRIYKQKLEELAYKKLRKDESDIVISILREWDDDIQSGLSVEIVYLLQCSIAVAFGVKLPNSYLRNCFEITLSLVKQRWFKSSNDFSEEEITDLQKYLGKLILGVESRQNFDNDVSLLKLGYFKERDSLTNLPYEIYLSFETSVDRRKR